MTRPRAVLLAITAAAATAGGWACDLASCATCSGGFQLSLRVAQAGTDPFTLELEVENGRSTWTCTPAVARCVRETELEGDREFDVTMTMVLATGPFQGLPCDASACLDIQIHGESDDADAPGTYGPERVTVSIIDESGQAYSEDFAPEYDRTQDYGGADCGYCDSRESFDERATID